MIYIEIILYLLNNGARAINAVSLASFFVHVRQEKKETTTENVQFLF